MNESLVKYLAGLLDADGSLSFSFKEDPNREGRYFVSLSLRLHASDNVDRHGFVESLPDVTGMGTTSRYGDAKQFVVWSISKRAHLEMLLPRLTKHMVIKAQHWNWMFLHWRDHRGLGTFSLDEREAMTLASKASRKERVGPLKPKNHPTWAWVAGYLDGDGCYVYRSGTYKSYKGRSYKQWSMRVEAVAHKLDAEVLDFLQEAFGGRVKQHTNTESCMVWSRNLGYQSRSFALRFLPKVAKHSRLKRHKIDQMIHHHRQRLSVPGTKVQAIV